MEASVQTCLALEIDAPRYEASNTQSSAEFLVFKTRDTSLAKIRHDIETLRTSSPHLGVAVQLEGQFSPVQFTDVHEGLKECGVIWFSDPCSEEPRPAGALSSGAPLVVASTGSHSVSSIAKSLVDGFLQAVIIDMGSSSEADMHALATLAELTGAEVFFRIRDRRYEDDLARMLSAIGAKKVAVIRALPVSSSPAEKEILERQKLPGNAPKIERVRISQVAIPLRQMYVSAMHMRKTTQRLFIEVETNDGCKGYGETSGTDAVAQTAIEMARQLIGQDPRQRKHIKNMLAGGRVYSTNGRRDWAAYGGLEMALFDWAGRADGVSFGRMLHGSADRVFKDHIDVACAVPALILPEPVERKTLPSLFADFGRITDVLDYCHSMQETYGFKCFKYKSAGVSADWDIRVLREMRNTFGKDVQIRWDPNGAYGVLAAVEMIEEMNDLDLEFYEDPVKGMARMAAVNAHSAKPLATNMCVVGFEQLSAAIGAQKRSVDILQSDITMWGGPQSIADLVAVAPHLGLEVAIHSTFEAGFGCATNLHLASAFPEISRAIDFGLHNLADNLIDRSLLPVPGAGVRVPEGPGLGVEPDHNRIEALDVKTHEVTK